MVLRVAIVAVRKWSKNKEGPSGNINYGDIQSQSVFAFWALLRAHFAEVNAHLYTSIDVLDRQKLGDMVQILR